MGLAGFRERYGDDAEAQIVARTEAAHEGIPVTLAAIKKVAEASRSIRPMPLRDRSRSIRWVVVELSNPVQPRKVVAEIPAGHRFRFDVVDVPAHRIRLHRLVRADEPGRSRCRRAPRCTTRSPSAAVAIVIRHRRAAGGPAVMLTMPQIARSAVRIQLFQPSRTLAADAYGKARLTTSRVTVGNVRQVKLVVMPQLPPPPPRNAQNRSGWSIAEAVTV